LPYPSEQRNSPWLSAEEINPAIDEEASKSGGVAAIANTCETETNANIRMEGAEEGMAFFVGKGGMRISQTEWSR
jgi:hypothetical protein